MTHGQIYLARSISNRALLSSKIFTAKSDDEIQKAIAEFMAEEEDAMKQFEKYSNITMAVVTAGFFGLIAVIIFAMARILL